MQGKLKNDDFFVGYRKTYDVSDRGKLVTITDIENHPIFGKRYKVFGYDEWFEENCFEYIN